MTCWCLICSLKDSFYTNLSQNRHFIWFSLSTYSTIRLLKVSGHYFFVWNRILCFFIDRDCINLLHSGHCTMVSFFILLLWWATQMWEPFKYVFLQIPQFSNSGSFWWEIVQFKALGLSYEKSSNSFLIFMETIALGEIRLPGKSWGFCSMVT